MNYRYVVPLDALRGIAALNVAIYHISWPHSLESLPMVRNAEFMVDFFFVLSGFCISLAYSRKLGNLEGFKHYLLKRFWRLYPLHFLFLAVFLLIECIKFVTMVQFSIEPNVQPFQEGWALLLLGHLLLVHALGFFDQLAFNVPSWSISAEMYTYLVFGGFCLLLNRWVSRNALSVFIILVCIGILYWHNDGSLINNAARFGFVRCLAGFFMGVVTFNLYEWALTRRGVTPKSTLWNLVATILVCLGIFMPGWVVGRTFAEFLALPFFGLVIFACAYNERGLLSRFLSKAPLRWLGKVSYSIYMCHMAVLFVFSQFLRFVAGLPLIDSSAGKPMYELSVLDGNVLLLIYVASVLCLSNFTWRLVEDRFRSRGKSRVTR